MIIWVDAQLSPAVARWITENFGVEAYAVRDLGLRTTCEPGRTCVSLWKCGESVLEWGDGRAYSALFARRNRRQAKKLGGEEWGPGTWLTKVPLVERWREFMAGGPQREPHRRAIRAAATTTLVDATSAG